MRLITLKILRTLTALRDTGSLVEASNRMCLTVSALSHQFKDLEDALGSQLFVRKSKPIQFTPLGRRVLALADQILPQIDVGEQEIRRQALGQAGRLCLGCECRFSFEWILAAAQIFRGYWPQVDFEVAEDVHLVPFDSAADGGLDLLITPYPGTQGQTSYIPLFRAHLCLVVPDGHALANKWRCEASDLVGEMIVVTREEALRQGFLRQFFSDIGTTPAIVRGADMPTIMIQHVVNRKGLAVLPHWAAKPYVDQGMVRAISLGRSGFSYVLYAALRTAEREIEHFKGFIDVARDYAIQSLPGVERVEEPVLFG